MDTINIMKDLAIIGIFFLCLLSFGLQHLSNYFFRKSLNQNSEQLIFVSMVSFIISALILYGTIWSSIKIF